MKYNIFKSNNFKKYFKNTIWVLAEKILRLTIGLFVGIWVARYLGPEQFGLLNYSISYVGLFVILFNLGLSNIIVKEIINNSTNTSLILGTSFYLRMVGWLVFIILIYLSNLIFKKDQLTNVLIYIISFSIIFNSFNIIDAYFQSQVLSKFTTIAASVSLILTSILKILLILSHSTLVYFVIILIFENFVYALFLIYFYHSQNLKLTNWKFSFSFSKRLLIQSWPLILSGIAVTVYMKIDQIMIKEFIDSTAVGYYAVAVKFTEIWIFIAIVLTNSIFPALINAKKESQQKYYFRLISLYKLTIGLSIIICIIVSIFFKTNNSKYFWITI